MIGRQHTHNLLRRQRTNAFTVTGTSDLSACVRVVASTSPRVSRFVDDVSRNASVLRLEGRLITLSYHIASMRSVHCGMCGGRICAYMLLRTYVVGYDDVGGDSYELLATLTHPLSSVHVSLSCLLETICWFTEAWSVISDPRLPPTAGQTPHNLRLQLPSSLRFSDASVGSRHPDVVKRVRSPRYDRTARKMRKNIWMYTYCALMSRRWFHFGVFVSFIEPEVLVLTPLG